MSKLIKLLTSIVTTRERLLRSNACLKTEIEMLNIRLELFQAKITTLQKDQDNTIVLQHISNIYSYLNNITNEQRHIVFWINNHEGSQWKN